MEKVKAFFKKIWEGMNDPRFEKPLLIALPCLSLILAALILIPGIRDYSARTATQDMQEPPVVKVSVEPSPTPTPTPSPTPSPEAGKGVTLTANSVDRDIRITVCGEDGRPVSGEIFRLDVQFPDGGIYSYDTETDGSCYLVRLSAGDYRIDMREKEGFVKAASITCTVLAQANYTPIQNIDQIAEVVDVSEISPSEVKPATNNQAPEETVPEVIITPEEAKETGEVVVEETPVIDANGNQMYSYEFVTGPNGYLLYRGTQEESDVLPIDEDGDGVPEYGLIFMEETVVIEPEEGEGDEGEEGEEPQEPVTETRTYTVSVELFNPDNTPNELYEIIATPLTSQVTQKVGWQSIDGKLYYYYEDGTLAKGLKRIDGKMYYFNQYGVKASSVGIDVSYYNKDINWQAVRAQGIDFAIIRVGGRGWSSGVLYDDIRTQEYLRGAKNAGLKVGVYFYSTAINTYEAVEEASVALSTLGGIPLDYPIFIDMEWSGVYPNGRSDNLSPAESAAVVTAFCETVRNGGYQAGVYASQNYYKYSMDYGTVSRYMVWLASYTYNNQLPDFSWRYDMWQFTDSGRLDGINGYVDMDVIF